MPNYVFNKVRFYGDPKRIQALRDYVTSDESCFDFNKIIPMPEELNMTAGSDEDFAIECANAYHKHGLITTCGYKEREWTHKMSFMEWVELGDKYLSNKAKYGFTTWYGWCCNKWGTKWNACEPIWEGNYFVSFNTAWSAPIPIFEKLTELFPDVSFEVDYADEDLGSNCGQISWDKEESFFWDPIDTFEFACDVWGYDPEELREEEEEYADY